MAHCVLLHRKSSGPLRHCCEQIYAVDPLWPLLLAKYVMLASIAV
jgi:hypothetical protein